MGSDAEPAKTAAPPVTEQAYRVALTLIDEGTRALGRVYKDSGTSAYRANLSPREHADLALRLAAALTIEEAKSA